MIDCFYKYKKSSYLPLGWDPVPKRLDPKEITKHYRFFVDKELEQTEFMDSNTFDEFEIKRGKRIKSDWVFERILGRE